MLGVSSILPNDVLREIFPRIDPSTIFNCILVCKDWFNIITEPAFRQEYLKIWTGHSKFLVGFLTYPYRCGHPCWDREYDEKSPAVRLLPVSKLGHTMKEKVSMKRPGYIVSFADGLLLSGTLPNNFHVFKPFTGGLPVELPPPPVEYENVAVAVIAQSPDHFKVILAEVIKWDKIALDIQTFSSSTGTWEKSQIQSFICGSYYVSIRLSGEPGFVSKGVVYWRRIYIGGLAAYDTNNQHTYKILDPTIVRGPGFRSRDQYFTYYGVSPQGFILCAQQIVQQKNYSDLAINLWVLEEDEKRWKLMHIVEQEALWHKHSAVFGGKRPSKPFIFVSFAPGTTDSIYVELEGVLFLYHLHTQELDRICGSSDRPFIDGVPREHRIDQVLPLTLANLGMWPGSSPVCHLH